MIKTPVKVVHLAYKKDIHTPKKGKLCHKKEIPHIFTKIPDYEFETTPRDEILDKYETINSQFNYITTPTS